MSSFRTSRQQPDEDWEQRQKEGLPTEQPRSVYSLEQWPKEGLPLEQPRPVFAVLVRQPDVISWLRLSALGTCTFGGSAHRRH